MPAAHLAPAASASASVSWRSILLRCFLMPERRSVLEPGENRENWPDPDPGYAHELVLRSRALSCGLGLLPSPIWNEEKDV